MQGVRVATGHIYSKSCHSVTNKNNELEAVGYVTKFIGPIRSRSDVAAHMV